MIKMLVFVLIISVFIPPLLWLICGGQLIYASQLARRRRLTERARRLINNY